MIEVMLAGVLLTFIIVILMKFMGSSQSEKLTVVDANNNASLTNDIIGQFVDDIKACQNDDSNCAISSQETDADAVAYLGLPDDIQLNGIDPTQIRVITCMTAVGESCPTENPDDSWN